jgi:predicted kinase
MTKLIAMQGLQGSGKSTWAKEFVAKNQNYYRVNSDELRTMLFDSGNPGTKWSRDKEDAVVIFQYHGVVSLLKAGKCVVWDNMNLSKTAQERCVAAAEESGAQLLWHPMTRPVALCVARDAARPASQRIGRAIIENCALYYDWIPWKEYPVLQPDGKDIVVFDLDGTLCNCEWRREIAARKKPFDWKSFFAACGIDKPNHPILDWALSLQKDHYIVISTGRHERYGDISASWLKIYGVNFLHMFMRRNSDNRHDYEAKNDMCQHLPKDRIKFVVDDRPQVVRMWRDNGIKVYPVGGYREPKQEVE